MVTFELSSLHQQHISIKFGKALSVADSSPCSHFFLAIAREHLHDEAQRDAVLLFVLSIVRSIFILFSLHTIQN
jgi:hypothetical protein